VVLKETVRLVGVFALISNLRPLQLDVRNAYVNTDEDYKMHIPFPSRFNLINPKVVARDLLTICKRHCMAQNNQNCFNLYILCPKTKKMDFYN
jgi:hypothetical protein